MPKRSNYTPGSRPLMHVIKVHLLKSGLSANDDSGYNCSANDRLDFIFSSMTFALPSKTKSLTGHTWLSDRLFESPSFTTIRNNRQFEGDRYDAHLDALVSVFEMFHPSPNTAGAHAHISVFTLKSEVNFSRKFFICNNGFNDSTLSKRIIVVDHFANIACDHVLEANDVTGSNFGKFYSRKDGVGSSNVLSTIEKRSSLSISTAVYPTLSLTINLNWFS
ncbi:hypothetical protein ANN_22869 [Periplaneta americana]|uniref:Uncharacterized protein n=1 Tax=Periplaneta americana TaxID=6978 RepID=A0ABQ8SKC0_PERAM|nr:hypothetical protein ANN_22869 [Periplaneta americana]